ncbi:MAG: hypothetical protein ACKO5E_17710 [bacterium]
MRIAKTVSTKSTGYVADFCAICRKTNRFQLLQLNYRVTVNSIPAGDEKITGYYRVCLDCDTAYAAEPAIYPVLCRKLEPLDEMHRTLPKPNKKSQERLEIEELIKNSLNSIPEEMRLELMQEPFLVLSPIVDTKLGSFYLDELGYLLFLLSVGLTLGIILYSGIAGPQPDGLLLAVASIATGLITIVFYKLREKTKFIMKFLIPNLAKALKPLKPSDIELVFLVNLMKAGNLRIGKILTNHHISLISRMINSN